MLSGICEQMPLNAVALGFKAEPMSGRGQWFRSEKSKRCALFSSTAASVGHAEIAQCVCVYLCGIYVCACNYKRPHCVWFIHLKLRWTLLHQQSTETPTATAATTAVAALQQHCVVRFFCCFFFVLMHGTPSWRIATRQSGRRQRQRQRQQRLAAAMKP